MTGSELLKVLDTQDRENRLWLFSTATLRVLFPNESDNTLMRSLRRHVRAGLLRKVKRGLYANERAQSVPADRLLALVPYLKPRNYNYVSQESRLSGLGRISQMPLDYLTVMTSGNSQIFHTCYGTVEFTHTKQPLENVLPLVEPDRETGVPVANEELALRDLKHARRNLEMVQ